MFNHISLQYLVATPVKVLKVSESFRVVGIINFTSLFHKCQDLGNKKLGLNLF